MSFYDEVLRELVAAIGAALFFGNGLALVRRRADAARYVTTDTRSAKTKGASRDRRVRPSRGNVAQAPIGRTVAFVALGFVMMIAGIAALVAS